MSSISALLQWRTAVLWVLLTWCLAASVHGRLSLSQTQSAGQLMSNIFSNIAQYSRSLTSTYNIGGLQISWPDAQDQPSKCLQLYRSHEWRQKWKQNFRSRNDKNITTVQLTIAVVSAQWILPFLDHSDRKCPLGDMDIDCHIRRVGWDSDEAKKADGLWYHIPQFQDGVPQKHNEEQALIAASAEPSAMFPKLSDAEYMGKFDIEATYRMCSPAQFAYPTVTMATLERLFEPPLPFAEKKTAIAYLNRNCWTKSPRYQIVRSMMDLNSSHVPVHAFGCDKNQDVEYVDDKVGLFRQYKFCITMENSLVKDYMSEKTWEGLMAGCIPIVLGPPNLHEYLPPDAILDYNKFGSAEKLYEEIVYLASNETAYNEKLAWKKRCIEDFPHGFRHLVGLGHSWSCRMCKAVYDWKQGKRWPQCLKNETWMKEYGPH